MAVANPVRFVKSWDTKVPAERSSAELASLLQRYGARGFTVSVNYEQGTILVGFTMPRSWQVKTDESVDVRLMVSFAEVERRLSGIAAFANRRYSRGSAWQRAQAERVAWRQMILFVESGLNAAAIGIQSIEEAFFAHTVLEGTNARVIDLVQAHRKQLTAGAAS